MLVESLRALFGSIHATCLSALFNDRAMETWYHPPLHKLTPGLEGHVGKLHRTTKILSDARRRGRSFIRLIADIGADVLLAVGAFFVRIYAAGSAFCS